VAAFCFGAAANVRHFHHLFNGPRPTAPAPCPFCPLSGLSGLSVVWLWPRLRAPGLDLDLDLRLELEPWAWAMSTMSYNSRGAAKKKQTSDVSK
jgi:hypothetical protein